MSAGAAPGGWVCASTKTSRSVTASAASMRCGSGAIAEPAAEGHNVELDGRVDTTMPFVGARVVLAGVRHRRRRLQKSRIVMRRALG